VKPFSILPRSTRRPSRLGLALTFGLLIGLLLWRMAMPGSPLWLDLAVLAGVGAFLLVARRVLRSAGSRGGKGTSRT
jgi:hypothetical protein